MTVPFELCFPAVNREPVQFEVADITVQRNFVVRFRLWRWADIKLAGCKVDPERLFYECTECRYGCGCPSFSPLVNAVPEEVLEHLRVHVALRH